MISKEHLLDEIQKYVNENKVFDKSPSEVFADLLNIIREEKEIK